MKIDSLIVFGSFYRDGRRTLYDILVEVEVSIAFKVFGYLGKRFVEN